MVAHAARTAIAVACLTVYGCDVRDADDLDGLIDERPRERRDASQPDREDEDAGRDDDAGSDDAGSDAPEREVFRPERRDFSAARLAQLQLPDGFAIEVFADELENPRMLAVGPDDSVYVSRPMRDDVVRLSDEDGDGRADARTTAISGIDGVHGLAIHEGQMYLAAVTAVHVAPLADDGTLGAPSVLIDDLPDGGQHPNRTIAVGPDGMLYVSIGSSCDACMESNPEHATLLQIALDGSGRRVFARGLRNTIGFGFHPETDALWGSDHGSDFRGNELPPDELNRIVEDADYGWPYCFGDRRVDPVIMAPPEMSKAAYCAMTEPAALEYPAHSAPIGLAFYDGAQFPERYRGDAFVVFRGSWNRYPATGYKVVRVRFEDGEPSAVEDFVSGFLIEDGRAHFARLAGVAIAGDGALLVSDDTNGIVYRVAYEGDD
jgi:glucose/arabinose dehydrogenase